MRINDKEVKRYLNNISNLLLCSSKERNQFLQDFRNNIDDFMVNNPNASFIDLEKAMGTPQEIADSFMENISSKDVKKRIYVKRILLISVIIIIVLISIMCISAYIDAHRSNHGRGTTTIITYSEENGTRAVIDKKVIEEYHD